MTFCTLPASVLAQLQDMYKRLQAAEQATFEAYRANLPMQDPIAPNQRWSQLSQHYADRLALLTVLDWLKFSPWSNGTRSEVPAEVDVYNRLSADAREGLATLERQLHEHRSYCARVSLDPWSFSALDLTSSEAASERIQQAGRDGERTERQLLALRELVALAAQAPTT